MFKLIEYPKNILLNTAIWPKNKSSLVYNLRTLFTLGNIMLLTVCLIYNATFHVGNFVELSESLYMLISVMNSFMKVMMLTINRNAFLKLLSLLDTPSFKNSEKIYSYIVSDFRKLVKWVEVIYRIQVNGTLVFMALFPVLESKPLPMDFPHFNNGTLHYPFYIFETISIFLAGYDNMALDLLTVGIISIAAVQLKILNKKLIDTEQRVQALGNYSEENVEKLTLTYLNECCSHYSDIEKFVKYLMDVFSVNIFVQLGTSVVAICNSGMIILTVEPVSLEAISLCFYITAMIAELGMYCWFGNIVYIESIEINTSCYMSQWYRRGTAVRKTLFMLMERSKKPLEIRGLNFVTLSFSTFLAILKWSYSYFTLLKNYTTKHS